MVMANNVYKTLGASAQTLTLLATVCLEDPVTQEKAKALLDKALAQRPDYVKAVVKKAELLSECTHWGVLCGCCDPHLSGGHLRWWSRSASARRVPHIDHNQTWFRTA